MTGGQDLRNVALRLEAAGHVGLKRSMYRNLRLAAAPAADRVRASALETLPKTGGLNQWVADSTIRLQASRGLRSAGLVLRMSKKGHDLPKIDQGVVRHPVYGQRGTWAFTRVEPGFFTRPLREMQPEATVAMLAVMREVAVEAGFR